MSLAPGWAEVERRSEGVSKDVRVGGCCIPKLTDVAWSFLGPDFWDGKFMTVCFAGTSIEPGEPSSLDRCPEDGREDARRT